MICYLTKLSVSKPRVIEDCVYVWICRSNIHTGTQESFRILKTRVSSSFDCICSFYRSLHRRIYQAQL